MHAPSVDSSHPPHRERQAPLQTIEERYQTLARVQGGDLSLEATAIGATFLLTLPTAPGFS